MLLFKKIVNFILNCCIFIFCLCPIYFLYGFLHVVLFPIFFVIALYTWSEDLESNRSFFDYYKEQSGLK